ncbi:hypothetical protein V6Z11_A09G189700 [Gossypium hirsutum]
MLPASSFPSSSSLLFFFSSFFSFLLLLSSQNEVGDHNIWSQTQKKSKCPCMRGLLHGAALPASAFFFRFSTVSVFFYCVCQIPEWSRHCHRRHHLAILFSSIVFALCHLSIFFILY